jgi:hypothetical protein
VFARRERLWAFPAEALQINHVISEYGVALEQIKSIAAKASAQSVNYAFGAALWNLYVSCDAE